MSEYNIAQDEDPVLNPRIPASEANHYAQQEGVDLKFTIDPTIDEYTVLMDRKTKERDRNLILSGGADGIMRSAGAIGVGFIGSLLSPLDLALNFLPIVGVGAKAATGVKAVGIGAKVSRALSRGIVTEQTLAARGIAMKGYTAAIIEGTVGQAITEIPLMISNKQDQTKYTSSDFALNVALGGAFGVGVHSLVKLGKSIHGRMKEAKLAHGRLTPETHENMAGAALEDFLEGGEIDPARVSLLDDNQLKGGLVDDRLLWHSGTGNGPEDIDGPIWFNGTRHNNLAGWGSRRDFQISVKGRDVPVLIDPYDSLALNAGFYDGYTDPKLNSDIHNYILKHTGEEDLTFTKDGKYDNGDEAADQASELHVRLQELTLENPEIGKELTDIFLEFKSRNPEAFEKLMDESSFMLVDRTDLPINSKEKIDQEEAKAALRSMKETSVEERTANANRQLEVYKNHELQKATEKAKQLDQEIAAGKTLEDPEPYTFTGDLEHINNELKALDDEILSLEDELGDLAFELDPRLTGDVGNIASYMGGRVGFHSGLVDPGRAENAPIYFHGSDLRKQLDQEIAAGPTDFTSIRQAEFPVPFSRWKAFLPENPPGNHTWKAEDVTYATQQFIPEYKELFDEFFELDPTLKDINMEFDPLLLKDHNAAGMYKGSEDRILIAEDYGQPSTVVHELTHASVVRRMRKDMESVGELKGLVLEGERYLASLRRYAALTENDGFRGIIEAYLKTVEHHGTQHTGGYSLASSVNVKTWERFSQQVKEPQYGLLNLDEFIAEGLSNRQFQLYLNSIKSGKETVLSKFMKMVKSIFKLEENPNSVLAQFLDGYETAIKQAGDRIDGPASLKMTKADVRDIGAPVLQQASNCIL
jgi:hypothetical protein